MAWKRLKPVEPTKRDWRLTILTAQIVVLAGFATGNLLSFYLYR